MNASIGNEKHLRNELKKLRQRVAILERENKLNKVLTLYHDVMKKKQAEEKLQKQNEFLTSIIESFTHSFYVIDVNDYTIKMANTTAKKDNYYKNIHCYELTHHSRTPCKGSLCPCPLQEVVKTKKPVVMEHVHSSLNGTEKIVEIHGYPVFNTDGTVKQMIEYTFDITQQKQAYKLLKTQKDLAIALNSAVSFKEGLRFCFNASLSLSGMDCGGIYLINNETGDLNLIYHKGLSSTFTKEVSYYKADSSNAKIIKKGKPIYSTYEALEDKKNTIKKAEKLNAIAIIPIRYKNNVLACLNLASHTLKEIPQYIRIGLETIATTIGSVLARLQSNTALRDSEERFRATFEQAAVGITQVSKNGNFLSVNDKLCHILGYTREELLTMQFQKIVHPGDLPKDLYNLEKVIEGKIPAYSLEERCIHRSGTIIWVNITVSLVRDSEGNGKYFLGVIEDITLRKKTEEELKQLTHIYNRILETIPVFVCQVNKDGIIENCQGAGLEKIGIKRENVIGKKTSSVYPHLSKPINEAMSGNLAECEDRGRYKGKKWWFQNYFFPDKYNKKGIIRIGFDISENVQAQEDARIRQEQLLQAEKMTSLGALVTGIAHEINNPNMFIGMGAGNLLHFFEEILPILKEYHTNNPDWKIGGRPFLETLKKINSIFNGLQEGSGRISKIIKSLKEFARPDSGNFNETVDINYVVESAVEIMHGVIKKYSHHFEIKLDRSIPSIVGNQQQIEQVIINLLSNACQSLTSPTQAMGITTSYNKETHKEYIIITDEGCGITKKNLKRISEPFFTTKQLSGGLGIGLSITFDIIKKHKGTIEYISKVNNGTTVTICLPCHNPLKDA